MVIKNIVQTQYYKVTKLWSCLAHGSNKRSQINAPKSQTSSSPSFNNYYYIQECLLLSVCTATHAPIWQWIPNEFSEDTKVHIYSALPRCSIIRRTVAPTTRDNDCSSITDNIMSRVCMPFGWLSPIDETENGMSLLSLSPLYTNNNDINDNIITRECSACALQWLQFKMWLRD